MKQRILFLMSDTGGGHRSAAQAIADAMHALYPNGYETLIEDILKQYTPWPINKIPDAYPWLIGPGLPLWKLIWSSTASLPTSQILSLVSPLLEPKILAYLERVQPDLVVSVHPLLNHLGLRWLRKLNQTVPFVTVVTDMVTVHPLWICPEVTRCLVPTEAAREAAIGHGMVSTKITVCGQPVDLKFALATRDKKPIRHQLGLDLNRQTILVMGGGEGFGRVFDIAQAIAHTAPHLQQVIVTGRNKLLKEQLESASWTGQIHIYGFVDNIPDLMQAADILVTKAGPSTIGESFIAGLPSILYGYIPEQERGNVTYVQQHQAGAYAETPQAVADLVYRWTTSSNGLLKKMSYNATQLGRPEAALTIATQLYDLLPLIAKR